MSHKKSLLQRFIKRTDVHIVQSSPTSLSELTAQHVQALGIDLQAQQLYEVNFKLEDGKRFVLITDAAANKVASLYFDKDNNLLQGNKQ